MKSESLLLLRASPFLSLCATGALLCGCASTGEPTTTSSSPASGSSGIPAKYRSDDGRTVEIGKRVPANGGLTFKDPPMEKCWIANDFKFTGYDTLYIAPTLSTARPHDDEQRLHEWAKEALPAEISKMLSPKGLFSSVVLKESDIKPGVRVLKLENTITEYAKGGGAARYFAGLYGGGQPVLRAQGKMTDGDKTVFTFEARRSGVSGGARMGG